MLNLPLTLKATLRDWKSGELTLLLMALIIAVACVTAISNFTTLINRQLEQSTANLLGADAVVVSSVPIPSRWRDEAARLALTQTTSVTFLSMVEYHGHLQLAQIHSVSAPYPLRGTVRVADRISDKTGHPAQIPAAGNVWLEPRLLSLLSADIGQYITIGAARLRIAGVIREQPGQMGNWFTISPRIIMNQQDIAKTKVIQRGSRVTYSWLLRGAKKNVSALKKDLHNKLTSHQEWTDSQNNNPTVVRATERTLSYLHLGTLMSLVLAGVAISMATLRYCQRHIGQVALLRCFGASQSQILGIYLGSLFLLGSTACLIGAAIGYALQPVLLNWLGGLLPPVSRHVTFAPLFFSLAAGMTLLLGFSAGHVWQLRKISAITMFRQQQVVWQNSTYVTYGFALLLLGVLALIYTGSWMITGFVLFACVAFIAMVVGSLWLVFGLLMGHKQRLPLNWRFGFVNIGRNLENSALQIIGIGLALTAMLSLTIVKNDLLRDWQRQLPPDAANFFMINIAPDQIGDINRLLSANRIQHAAFYPIVRARLTAINHQSVQQRFGEEAKNINALRRELNLSWTDKLPPGNEITAGRWQVRDPHKNWVSVEKGVAERLGLKLGDLVGFQFGDGQLTAEVTSIRRVDWSSFNPNFFMLFKPGFLDDAPRTMLTSMYVPPSRQEILIEMTRQFPNITLIDITQAINKVRSVLTDAGNAISFITFFALLAGLIIVALAILSFSSTKQQETRLLKILGMRQYALLWIRTSEAFILGVYAGLLASITAILVNRYLAEVVLNIPFSPPWHLILTVPLYTAGITVVINFLIQRNQYQHRKQTVI
ncbi:ABC transporter permease [Legionella spiritensis]|uniref:ABC transporter permease n=1 Tax=Legionella spiritensis TaxID=452 RepID=UPI000F6EDE6D|nr:FtsX-like permease family protein [Legionella spiritensis]VEG91644.1 FtsX-like permease family [Legionella spiritensis]